MMKAYKINILLLFILSSQIISQEVEPEITLDRKKLIILTGDIENSEITDKIYQIASSSATKLKRYDIIDRNQLKGILAEQKLQHSGIVDQDQAVEIGKVAGANEALLIQVNIFGQKGVPTDHQDENDIEDEPKTGLFGWVVKQIVKAEVDRNTENVERYPNNIQTIIDGEISLINVETGQSMDAFSFNADYTGGVKAKSLSSALKLIRDQISNELKKLYQLSSEVLDIQGNEVTLLLGKNMGVQSGTVYEISTLDERKVVRSREITIPGKQVALVEVKSVSTDASQGRILRKWDEIKPGYQARELTGNYFAGGFGGSYGFNPEDNRLKIYDVFRPLHRFGGDIYGEIGMVKDSRQDYDFHFGFGFSLNYRLIHSSPFSLGPTLNIPLNFHVRGDDGINDVSHIVFLPIINPRLGLQSEIMLSPKMDLVIRAEYIFRSADIGEWRYTEEKQIQDGNNLEEVEETLFANWDGPYPEINYQGWTLTIGIRIINSIKINSQGFSFED